MSSAKFVIGGIFIVAAIVGSIPLFFHDYVRVSNQMVEMQNSRLTSNQAKLTQQSNKDVLGTYNNIILKRSDLTAQEKQTLFDAENQSFKAVEEILGKRYFETIIKDYMKKINVADMATAEKRFIEDKSNITKDQMKTFILQNAEHPQLKGKSLAEQENIVKPYLQRQAAATYIKGIISEAIQSGNIEIIGAFKPIAPRTQIEIGDSPTKGANNAQVTIVEFADYQCPFCAQVQPIINNILSDYKGKIKFVFKHFPLNGMHPEATPAAIAAECANRQNQYWKYHELLFNEYNKLGEATYLKLAQEIGLNIADFNTCRKDPEILKKINADFEYGKSLGIEATPAFYINGIQVLGALPKEEFEKIIQKELATKK